ncbi:RagB/SusD family nutrient uptake outer membrane protein [Alistipes sp. An54]|uniref:RagB/SusD family nutrient uptake outer membrane protein n=1 Tax=Alistipes sp. An54 TaxID=1965645 RepID=UPI000B385E99|nr:RagB/SusD family nutrient uptake outer membrane protein [Alistipes sp. An54]OUN76071.1 RagB/SusD family nutrient uptake outer membrane protein [Alistipes sp. An54]
MKRILRKIALSATVLGAAAMMNACGSDWLELSDPNSLSPTNFPKKIEHVDLLVNSVYGAQHHWCFLGNYWAGYVMYCLDHTIDMLWHEDPAWIDICAGEVKAGNNKVTDPWTALSLGVYYANTALEEIASYRTTAPETETEALNNYEGECLFFRAYYWWHMLSLYGEPDAEGVGIPIVRTVPRTLEEMYIGREKTGACYQAIIEDLDRAVDLLTQTDPHRVTVWAAKAFRAKACFFAGQRDLARTYLEDCIANSGKTLETFDRYRMMFNGYDAYEYNSESFYEMGNRADPTSGSAYGSPNTGSTLSLYYPPFCIAPDGTRTAMSYGNQYMHDRNLGRFGYTDPAPQSAAVMKTRQGADGQTEYYLDEAYLALQQKHRDELGREADGPDPRLYVCALQPFVDEVQMTIDGVNATRKVAQVDFGKWWEDTSASTGNDPETFYGWPVRKYNFLEGHLLDATRNVAGYNIYFLRLPEIYLMYALLLRDEDSSTALEYVNKVHRRAYNYPVDAPSEVDYRSLSDRTRTVDATDHLANDPLLYELWAEVFGEMRWWEYVRLLDLGEKEKDYYKTISGPGSSKTNIVWKETNYAMPIPTSEFENNPNPAMVQTPGY